MDPFEKYFTRKSEGEGANNHKVVRFQRLGKSLKTTTCPSNSPIFALSRAIFAGIGAAESIQWINRQPKTSRSRFATRRFVSARSDTPWREISTVTSTQHQVFCQAVLFHVLWLRSMHLIVACSSDISPRFSQIAEGGRRH